MFFGKQAAEYRQEILSSTDDGLRGAGRKCCHQSMMDFGDRREMLSSTDDRPRGRREMLSSTVDGLRDRPEVLATTDDGFRGQAGNADDDR